MGNFAARTGTGWPPSGLESGHVEVEELDCDGPLSVEKRMTKPSENATGLKLSMSGEGGSWHPGRRN